MDGFSQFLPIGPAAPPKPAAAASHGHGSGHAPKPAPKPPADPESTPQRQMTRRIGNYGAQILRDSIKVDYGSQYAVWEKHIGDTVTAFSIALGRHEKTLDDVRDAERASAELAMFIFSLVTGVIMKWAGTFVQYKLVPQMLTKPVDKFIHVTDRDWPLEISKLIKITENDYSKDIAAFVGGVTQDLGKDLTKKAASAGFAPDKPYVGDAARGDIFQGSRRPTECP